METKLKVDIQGEDNKIIDSFIITRSTIGQTSRRFKLLNAVMEQDLNENDKNNLLNCCALASVLHNAKGQLLYPDDDAAQRIYDEMDYEIYNLLIEAYTEINGNTGNLKAKKKRS